MKHSKQTLARVEAIFHAALAAEPSQRPFLVAARCDNDSALIEEVNSLVNACAAEENATATAYPKDGTRNAPAEKKKIGPYQIERLIGRGGMGAVYLANRADGQFEQQVAIKLVDLPLATDFFRERFRQERQILAGLQHPYIARLLDGGITPEGDLYIAMEYVDGVPIHTFCKEKGLGVAERLALFLNVCEAVQFAHQNLVVHRDLKPDNILIAKDGTPRLLDFGTAKLVSPTTERSGAELTRQGYNSFTPQYASPEQVLGNAITTASDTYSLGVLLYLLLTGAFPYQLTEFTTEEMVRVICESAPRAPNALVDSGHRPDGDVAAIMLKALRKEPPERYLTAEQLAWDVQAYLDHKPVNARQGTFRYRAGKFIRRHRLALAGAALLALSVIGGIAGVVWQARRANLERMRAEARSEDLRQLSNSLLSELDEAIQQIPGSTQAQKLLVTTVMQHLDRTAKDASNDPQLQIDLANAYTKLANVQGNPYDQNVGDPPGALATLKKALSVARSLAAKQPNDALTQHALAFAQQSRAEVLYEVGRTEEAVTDMRSAAAICEQLASRPGASTDAMAEAASVYGGLGDMLGQIGGASLSDPSAAMAAQTKSLDLDQQILKIDPSHVRARRGVAIAHMKIGSLKLDTDPAEALADFTTGLDALASLPPAVQDSLGVKRVRNILTEKSAFALKEIGRYDEALARFEPARAAEEALLKTDQADERALNDLNSAAEKEAECYEEREQGIFAPDKDPKGDAVNANRLLQESRQALERLLKDSPANSQKRAVLGGILVRIGIQQRNLGQTKEGLISTQQGIAMLKAVALREDAKSVVLDEVVWGLATAEPESLRDPALAVKYGERLVEMSHRQNPDYLLDLAIAYRAAGQPVRARSLSQEGLKLLPGTTTALSRTRKLLEGFD